MIDIFQNPFSSTDIKLTRPSVGASSQAATGTKFSSLSIKDEYLSSVASSYGTYKRSSIPTVLVAGEEIVPKGTVTDAMREEVKNGDSWREDKDLLPIAYSAYDEIFRQVLYEKGVMSLDGAEFYAQHSFSTNINSDGVFIFHADGSYIEGFDQDFVEEVCLALESAFNSSSLNIEENPHLFTSVLPSVEPDYSEFVDELRSEISCTFQEIIKH